MRNPHRSAFTLLELVIVIFIIVILTSLVLAVVARARHHVHKAVAFSEVKNLETAWKQYYSEYGKWPAFADETSDVAMVGAVRDLLQGENPAGDNPRGFRFVDFSRADSDRNPINPWGNPRTVSDRYYYYARFDVNCDGSLATRSAVAVRRSVIVWTRNADNQRIIGSWSNKEEDD
jgi:type II secretory pathway pseudopilin PulG